MDKPENPLTHKESIVWKPQSKGKEARLQRNSSSTHSYLSPPRRMDSSSSNHGSMGCGSHQSPEAARLCARGCGFFGTAENRGLCSKCYTDYLKETMAKAEAAILSKVHDQSKINNIPEISELVDALSCARIAGGDAAVNSLVSVPPVAKNRCGLCNKKVGLLGFECRCGVTFCRMHRLPEGHSCNFDFKKAGKIMIEKENPRCKADKIRDRV